MNQSSGLRREAAGTQMVLKRGSLLSFPTWRGTRSQRGLEPRTQAAAL